MRSVPKENYNNNKEQLVKYFNSDSSFIEEKLCNVENINADQITVLLTENIVN